MWRIRVIRIIVALAIVLAAILIPLAVSAEDTGTIYIIIEPQQGWTNIAKVNGIGESSISKFEGVAHDSINKIGGIAVNK